MRPSSPRRQAGLSTFTSACLPPFTPSHPIRKSFAVTPGSVGDSHVGSDRGTIRVSQDPQKAPVLRGFPALRFDATARRFLSLAAGTGFARPRMKSPFGRRWEPMEYMCGWLSLSDSVRMHGVAESGADYAREDL